MSPAELFCRAEAGLGWLARRAARALGSTELQRGSMVLGGQGTQNHQRGLGASRHSS